MDKRKLIAISAVIIIVLLPSAVFASVVIQQTYGVNTKSATNPFIVQGGPNYGSAHQLGFAHISSGGKGIIFGYVDNDTRVELVNVAEIVNETNLKNQNMYVYMSVSSTAKSNITIYYRSTPVPSADIFPTLAQLGTAIQTTSSGVIDPAILVVGDNTTSTAPVWYLSAIITGNIPSALLTLNYEMK